MFESLTDKNNRQDSSYIKDRIQYIISHIDRLVSEQLSQIINHEQFTALEAAWKNLQVLQEEILVQQRERIKVKLIPLTWSEICKDGLKSSDYEQSQLFRLIYSDEFGTPGGEPFGILVGDYYISKNRRQNLGQTDIGILNFVSKVATAAFCPFICGLDSTFLGIDSYLNLKATQDFYDMESSEEYREWRKFRGSDSARFVGLVAPRYLIRKPYQEENCGFIFRKSKKYSHPHLWGNSAFLFARVIVRSFADHGWFANIRGFPTAAGNGGTVALHLDDTIDFGTEVVITEDKERQLNANGIVSFVTSKYSTEGAFFTSSSPYHASGKNSSDSLTSYLEYTLCVCRFAHHVKLYVRNRLGSFDSALTCEQNLQHWLSQYTLGNSEASESVRMKKPLKEGRVEVSEIPGISGKYNCVMYIRPHFQLDHILSTMKLETELTVG